jgi:SHS2 domain-containing protein
LLDFEVLQHTADIKIRAYGTTKKELFHNALVGMFQVIQPITSQCTIVYDRLVCKELPDQHSIEIASPDTESLLVDFLSEALYLSDTYDQAYLDVSIDELSSQYMKATLYGVSISGFLVVEIKAVTYHELIIQQHNGIWSADIVFDI